MSLKFRNTATGVVVKILEPHEMIEAARQDSEQMLQRDRSQNSERRARAKVERARRHGGHVERMLKHFSSEECTRWERVADNTPVGFPGKEAKATPPAAITPDKPDERKAVGPSSSKSEK